MKESGSKSTDENRRKLGELIKDIKFGMLTTVEVDGTLHSRPMVSQLVDFDGDLWFFSNRSSSKIRSIEKDQHVNVSYSDPDSNRYVSVSGRAEIVSDKTKMAELWNPMFKTWFHEGLEDPELVLIKIQVESAEYWDSPSKMIVRLVGFAKAMTGKSPYPAGDHQKIHLPH